MESLHVTKVFLPPFEEYCDLLRQVWATHIVTNDGPLYRQFEDQLRQYTRIDHLACLGNGTLALQLALRALELNGREIITTPFTHVASSDSLLWEQCRPVYVDIDPETLNIDPTQIEARITDRTGGIVGVHVYGNPCDVEAIEHIARPHGLRVVYDGAHAFGTQYQGRSIFAYGDLATASFHATKGMHTIEGGALFGHDEEMIEQIRRLAYYGMDQNKQIVQKWGTNGKMCEFSAAMGILCLRYFEANLERKKQLYELYGTLLANNDKIRFQKLTGTINYSYVPIILESEDCKQEVLGALSRHGIYPREYFSPSLETVFSERIECHIAYDISHRVLCLPMSDYLQADQVTRVCDVIDRACEMCHGRKS
ncbi:MAG: DegT/DnrJ/EryC1/StrS family aminotransferase [Phycisphaerales bacterium]|nr:MAG: DegT/DnrJ/EryC1/StrS family aminotransferase [Phycisphaerales bacterium]